VRFALLIIALAVVTVGIVHLRREEIRARHQLQDLQIRQVKLRRALYDQQARLGMLTCPRRVRQRAAQLAVDLTDRKVAPVGVARWR
jgi:hypothetical protein